MCLGRQSIRTSSTVVLPPGKVLHVEGIEIGYPKSFPRKIVIVGKAK